MVDFTEPVEIEPLSPVSPSAKDMFRRGGRSYREAASEEFSAGWPLSPRSSKETEGSPCASPGVTPRFARGATDPSGDSSWSLHDRKLRRSARIMLDGAMDGLPEIPHHRRRSTKRRSSIDAASPRDDLNPSPRRNSRFRDLARQII